jgi:hypothetical protein
MKFERDSDGYAEVSFMVRGDGLWSVLKLLRHLQANGNIGHSHDIVVDSEATVKEGKRTYGWDGDGSDSIDGILVNGEPLDIEKFDEEEMKMARIADRVSCGFVAELKIKPKWEKPKGRRKSWRLKKPDGTYEYRDSPPENTDTPKEYPHERRLAKKDLNNVLSKGHYTIISAGRNPNDPEEAKMSPDDEFFHKRHQELQNTLERIGYDYTEVVGHYGGKESSFLVFHDGTRATPKTEKSMMVHHSGSDDLKKRKEVLNNLGKALKQDSVLHGSAGKNTISFTTGKNAGKECGGEGWKETPDAKDFYTDIELSKGKHTKFALNVDDCFEKGFFSSVDLERRILSISRRM